MSSLELTLEPADNFRLANLCGVLDENLRQLEQMSSVQIRRRGLDFTLEGEPDAVATAGRALQNLYHRSRHALGPDELQAALDELSFSAAEGLRPLITRRSDLRPRSERQAQYLKQIQEHVITFGVGPAGTGKTWLAVACAVDALEREEVKRIILVRPTVEAGEKLGFLPGDLNQKVDPFLRPLYDALYDLLGFERTHRLFEKGTIEVAPLAFMRGRTLNHSFIILDEAQNTTPEQMKMFLTRIGFGTRAVITGDVTQIDLHRTQKSGLIDARMVLQKIEDVGFTVFQAEDVVRHPLVQQIVAAYEHRAASTPRP
jgi:phosphate starvation-inducible PhoH-like protein